MNQLVSTDRLAVDHIATFVWNTCDGKPKIGAYRVVEHLDHAQAASDPPQASSDWLAPFIGKPVEHLALVLAPEGNEMAMLLVSIDAPRPDFAVSDVTPHWFSSLRELRLEEVVGSSSRDSWLARIMQRETAA